MTDRNRQLAKISANATRAARLPPLGKVVTGKADLDGWITRVNEHLEVREGVRGNPFEKALTGRDLVNMGLVSSNQVIYPKPPDDAEADGVVVSSKGNRTVIGWDAFAKSIIGTKLYTDLTKRIDDPSRFDDLHSRTKAALLEELAPLNGEIRAQIQRTQEQFSNANEAFAQEVLTIRASVARASAGVREVRFASASENRATAGVVTQVTARLDNFSGGAPGTATVETKMTAIADRATGLEAQYVVKVSAGGSVAGFGLAATAPVGGTPSSAFIIQADKFAVVDSSYAGGLTNSPPSTAVMFGTDSDGAYVGGNLKVGGKATVNGNTTLTVSGVSYSAAFVANDGLVQNNGIFAFTNSSSGAAIQGFALNGGTGVVGQAQGGTLGTGLTGTGIGAGKTGVVANGTSGATGLAVFGPMTKDSNTVVTNLNAELWNGISVASTTSGAATATLTLTNKPGSGSANVWLPITKAGVTLYIPVWT